MVRVLGGGRVRSPGYPHVIWIRNLYTVELLALRQLSQPLHCLIAQGKFRSVAYDLPISSEGAQTPTILPICGCQCRTLPRCSGTFLARLAFAFRCPSSPDAFPAPHRPTSDAFQRQEFRG